MRGRLVKLYGSWFIQYDILKTLPLHSNFVTMTDYVFIKGIKVYDGDEVDFTEVLVNPMGREVDPNDLGQNHSKCIWYARPSLVGKDEQKQHIVDMMKSDEELGLYDEPFKHKVETIPVEEILANRSNAYEFIDFDKKELEDVFNDEKREIANRVIQQHKVLKDLTLINPAHLIMTSNGHGEFPDGYKLTHKGIQYIIEQLNKE